MYGILGPNPKHLLNFEQSATQKYLHLCFFLFAISLNF